MREDGASTVTAVVARAAASNPDAIAICAPGRPTVSYTTLHDHLDGLAAAVRRALARA